MSDNFITIFTISLFAIIQSTLVSWMILKTICFSRSDYLSFFYISSEKSTTNARLLGGLAVSVSMIFVIISLLTFYPKTLNTIETKLFFSTLVSMLVATFYGYIDDKYEVRVRFKLALQLVAVLSFSYFSANNVSPNHPILAFVFSSILGLALINGTNLLDGLDTLSVKLGIASSLAFLYLGIISNSTGTIYLSVILISSLTMFYFFNREPAKVYMGEIGGSIIGLIYYIQSSLCFSQLKHQMSMPSALALVLLAGSFPIFELGISFLRRIISKKSPFVGDKFHLHYVIKNKYKLSASDVASRMGISSLLILGFGFLLANAYNPILALAIVITFTAQCYLWVCLDEWKSNMFNENTHNMFKIFEGKTVKILDSTQIGTLDISLTDELKRTTSKKKSA